MLDVLLKIPEFKYPACFDKVYNISNYNIKDGNIAETLKETIKKCGINGGGTIVIPEGEWKTGPIHLMSNVQLRLEKGCKLIFSDNIEDYLPVVFTRWEGIECYNYSPLIYAKDCENIAITGEGELVGNGESWWHWKNLQHTGAQRLYDAEYNKIPVTKRVFGTERDALRPQFFQIINCKNVLLAGVRFLSGPMWTVHPVYSENVVISGIEVISTGPNTDGINPDSCNDVLVENCYFETGDDCIAINSGMNEDGARVNRPCTNIYVRNCRTNEGHASFAIGSGMSGGVENIFVDNCLFNGGERGIRLKSMRGRGGYVKNVRFSDIEINNMRNEAIQINTYYEATTIDPKSVLPPLFDGISINNITGSNSETAIHINGLPEKHLKNISLENISLQAKKGLFVQNVDNIALQNVNIDSNDE